MQALKDLKKQNYVIGLNKGTWEVFTEDGVALGTIQSGTDYPFFITIYEFDDNGDNPCHFSAENISDAWDILYSAAIGLQHF